jgi:hypothetical protein
MEIIDGKVLRDYIVRTVVFDGNGGTYEFTNKTVEGWRSLKTPD